MEFEQRRVKAAGSEDDGSVRMLRETIFESLAEAAAAVRAVFAFTGYCFALLNTLWWTVNWIPCAAGLRRR